MLIVGSLTRIQIIYIYVFSFCEQTIQLANSKPKNMTERIVFKLVSAGMFVKMYGLPLLDPKKTSLVVSWK